MTTQYLVDTNNLTGYAQVLEEINPGNQVVKVYSFGTGLISQTVAGAGLAFYGFDGHGNVRYLTDLNGAVTDTYTYDAFGILIGRTGTTDNNFLYCGEQFDPQLGFYNLRARYMNPNTGRFWTMDEYEGSVGDPCSLHKYLFACQNPANRIDPSGFFTTNELFAVGAIVAVIAAIAIVSLRQIGYWTSYYSPYDSPSQNVTAVKGGNWDFTAGSVKGSSKSGYSVNYKPSSTPSSGCVIERSK